MLFNLPISGRELFASLLTSIDTSKDTLPFSKCSEGRRKCLHPPHCHEDFGPGEACMPVSLHTPSLGPLCGAPCHWKETFISSSLHFGERTPHRRRNLYRASQLETPGIIRHLHTGDHFLGNTCKCLHSSSCPHTHSNSLCVSNTLPSPDCWQTNFPKTNQASQFSWSAPCTHLGSRRKERINARWLSDFFSEIPSLEAAGLGFPHSIPINRIIPFPLLSGFIP